MSGEIWIFAAFFALVAGGILAAGYYVLLRPAAARSSTTAPVTAEEPESAKEVAARALASLGHALPASRSDLDNIRKHLAAAGYRWPSAAAVFYGIKLTLTVAASLIIGWIAWLSNDSLFSAAIAAAAAGGFAFKALDRVLFALIRARNGRIRRSLPAALDLMVLSIEAGQSLDQGLQNAARELQFVYPDLCEELALTFFELQLGKSRAAAFQTMGDRCQEPELRKLSKLLVDTDRFGTSLGPVLRAHAKYLRVRMRQSAQEQARKVGVKLVFPVFFLIFPSVLMVTLGPAVLLLMDQLRALMGQ